MATSNVPVTARQVVPKAVHRQTASAGPDQLALVLVLVLVVRVIDCALAVPVPEEVPAVLEEQVVQEVPRRPAHHPGICSLTVAVPLAAAVLAAACRHPETRGPTVRLGRTALPSL